MVQGGDDMSNLKITGVLVPPIVPFTNEGEIDCTGLKKYLNWLIEKGIDSFFSLGSFGGGPLMSLEERKLVAEITVEEVNGRIPIICHIAAQNTHLTLELAKHAEKIGVDAIASLPPGYYKYKSDHVKEYFSDLLDAVNIPVYIYNNPGTIGYNIEPELLGELADMGLAGIKDSSFDIIYLQKAMNAVNKEDFNWINGTAPLMFPAIMAGADACVLGTALAYPELAVSLWEAIQTKDYDKAAKLQKEIIKLVQVMNLSTDLIGIHEMLRMRGFSFGGYPRKPLKLYDQKLRDKLKEELTKLKLL